MPITKSAKKALRQNTKRRARNIVYKSNLKKLLKEARFLVSQNKIQEAKNLLPQVYKILDKSAKVGVIKKNTAKNKRSKIARLINSKS
ncbi:MAG: 30S ribosomal protein S20 [Candidatus Pacebacteria bacterium]|nr:30S ribosomal protein S20 [Candidatus Paceibacterota bacterium]